MEDTRLIRQALAYAGELYRELSQENGMPTVGTQNQAVDFILGDPELRRAVAAWAQSSNIDEASLTPPRRLTYDATYHRVREFLERAMQRPVFERPLQDRP